MSSSPTISQFGVDVSSWGLCKLVDVPGKSFPSVVVSPVRVDSVVFLGFAASSRDELEGQDAHFGQELDDIGESLFCEGLAGSEFAAGFGLSGALEHGLEEIFGFDDAAFAFVDDVEVVGDEAVWDEVWDEE